MDLTNFLGIAIVGTALSIALEWITKSFGATGSKLITVGLSILVGGVYYFLSSTPWWGSILGVLGTASTVYALFIKKSPSTP